MADGKGKIHITVKRSIAGLGLFTEEAINEGDFVISYVGDVIATTDADELRTRYLFEMDDNYTLDGKSRENLARYMNHFCRPNVEADIVSGQINFYALRDIKGGEELGYDYGEEYFEEFVKPTGCKCTSCA